MIPNSFTEPILEMLHGAVSNLKLKAEEKKRYKTMEDEDRNITGQTSNQSIPNNTTTISVERTSTRKLSIPILEKNDHTNAKLSWRKVVLYIKMTRDIDLSKMTNSKEILPQFRDQLEDEIKDLF